MKSKIVEIFFLLVEGKKAECGNLVCAKANEKDHSTAISVIPLNKKLTVCGKASIILSMIFHRVALGRHQSHTTSAWLTNQ